MRLTYRQVYGIWNAAKAYAEASKRCNGCAPGDKSYKSFLSSREKLSYHLSLALPEIALSETPRYAVIESLKTNCMIHLHENGGKLGLKDQLSLWAASAGIAPLLGMPRRAERVAKTVLVTLQAAVDAALSSMQITAEEIISNRRAKSASISKIPLHFTYLVVDDDETMASLMQKRLGMLGAPPDKLLVARSGGDAIKLATGVEGPLVILMDYSLPDKNGGKASQEILRLRDRSDQQTIIIGVSAYIEMFAAGIDYGPGVYAALPKEIIHRNSGHDLAQVIDCAVSAMPRSRVPPAQPRLA